MTAPRRRTVSEIIAACTDAVTAQVSVTLSPHEAACLCGHITRLTIIASDAAQHAPSVVQAAVAGVIQSAMTNPITCARAELYIAAMLDGRLMAAHRSDLNDHLQGCARCGALAETAP